MAPESEHDSRQVLDAAVRAHLEGDVDSGEVITSWLVVAGTRNHEDGGVVITAVGPDESAPQWQVRGLLATALRLVDRSEDGDQ